MAVGAGAVHFATFALQRFTNSSRFVARNSCSIASSYYLCAPPLATSHVQRPLMVLDACQLGRRYSPAARCERNASVAIVMTRSAGARLNVEHADDLEPDMGDFDRACRSPSNGPRDLLWLYRTPVAKTHMQHTSVTAVI